MIERRGGNFDLSRARRIRRYTGMTLPRISRCFPRHQRLIFRRIVGAFRDRALHLRIVLLELFVEPGQLRKHLQIAKVLRAE